MIKAKRTAEDIFKARMRTILNEYGNTEPIYLKDKNADVVFRKLYRQSITPNS